MTDIETYLHGMIKLREGKMPAGMKYGSIEEFVLKHGREFTTQPRPANVPQMTMRYCYHNALELAMERGWVYVEGYGISVIPTLHARCVIPTLHAWCVDPAHPDLVIDPTWTDGRAYYGVELNTEFVIRMAVETEHYGVLDDWRRGWPLLREDAPDGWKYARVHSGPEIH